MTFCTPSGSGLLKKFLPLLLWGLPAQHLHGNVIATPEIGFQLPLKVSVVVELKKIIETLLVVTVRTLYFSIVPGRPWPNELMLNMELLTQQVKGMDTVSFGPVGKLGTVVSLKDFGA